MANTFPWSTFIVMNDLSESENENNVLNKEASSYRSSLSSTSNSNKTHESH